jgi:DNA-binding GntR family transcriptional regulator
MNSEALPFAELAYRQTRGAILQSEFNSGCTLVEKDLVRWVGVNLTSVRQGKDKRMVRTHWPHQEIIAALASSNSPWVAAQMPTHWDSPVLSTDSPEPEDPHV